MIMQSVYLHKFLQVPNSAKGHYNWFVHNPNNSNPSASPTECTQCGQCEERCPQNLKIIENLKYAFRVLDKNI